MPLKSMTGYASLTGLAEGVDWVWEARSVNARGLDLRLRLPDGLDVLEPEVRRVFGALFARGSITVGLRAQVGEDRTGGAVNQDGLAGVLSVAQTLTAAAKAADVPLAPLSVGELLSNRAVFETGRPGERLRSASDAVVAGIAPLADGLAAARAGEGAALGDVLARQLAALGGLVDGAVAAVSARNAAQGVQLRDRVTALLTATDRVDEDRLAQELALLAVKGDVTEELDRLRAHIAAATALLTETGPVGRKLDFLMQEFNREANTLCAKSGSAALTALGLDMKVIIDQMREQCQNVE